MSDTVLEAAPRGLHGVRRTRARVEIFRQLLRSPSFVVGSIILLFWIFCALFGSLIETQDPLGQNLLAPNAAPSLAHWLGTDQLGRDMFSRVIAGSRDILLISPLATLLGVACGTILGLVMGYFGGLVDILVSRFVEAVLALPVVIVAFLFIVAVGHSTITLILVIGFVFTPLVARTVRSAVLSERGLDYVASARLRGEGPLNVMFVEILPNVLAPIIVELTVRLGYAIFSVATLSFLGFGVQPPTPDWGADIFANYGLITAGFWWETLFPALAIATLVVAVNLVSDSVDNALAG